MTNGVTSVLEAPMATDTSWFAYGATRPTALSPQPRVALLTEEARLEVTLTGNDAGWVLPTLQAIAGLCRLDRDWDSYGGLPVRTDQLQSALTFIQYLSGCDIPTPMVVPTNDGGIQFEWDLPAAEIEIRTAPGRHISSCIEGRNGRPTSETIPLNDPSRLLALAKLLAQRAG